jgi:RNA 2',3'-cyclic 3'-phosphodiesterase
MTTRTFVALALPSEVKAALADLRRALPSPPRGLRMGAVEQAHLTLVFLGDLDPAALIDVRQRAGVVAATTGTFEAGLAALGAFPHAGRARVAWVGWGSGADAVVRLQGALVAALGRPVERRRFTPHVTLARAREPLDLRAWLAAAPAWSSPTWQVDALDVMASELAPAGAIHSLIDRVPLANG